MDKEEKKKIKKKRLSSGVCDYCWKEQPLCYICVNCGLTICQRCFIENQKMFTRTGITWVCPNCLNWQTL